MSLQLLKLGTLALKTLSKSVASRLKRQAAYAPKFRQFIVSIAQANHRITTRMQRRIYRAILIFEVQRSSRSEAKKEEARREELEAMKKRNEDLATQVELLRHKLEEVEQLAKRQGLAGIFKLKHANMEGENLAKPS
ncbi:Syntaxin of plants 61 [Hibiscus syriacus]|uniref:Syntaxin of plants 61 n=1 Tax=Hibiscus syriacus TaxID=106335 RepID=A0A6A2WQ76_HIBSY|nr:Syntaxin of plants 61 [Hibiscus syriacus]